MDPAEDVQLLVGDFPGAEFCHYLVVNMPGPLSSADDKALAFPKVHVKSCQLPLDGAQCPASRMPPLRAETCNMAYSSQTPGLVMESNANAALEDRVLLLRSGADLALLDACPLEFAKASMNDLEPNRSHRSFIFRC